MMEKCYTIHRKIEYFVTFECPYTYKYYKTPLGRTTKVDVVTEQVLGLELRQL
jgi:hypothetical protein